MSNKVDFVISVEFDDGDKWTLEMYGTPGSDKESVQIDDRRLDLIKTLQQVARGEL